MLEQTLYDKRYLGRDGFYWWIGQIPNEGVWRENIDGYPADLNTASEGWGERYRVRIMGSMLDSWTGVTPVEPGEADIPDEELPWAIVLYPVTAGGGNGASYQSANISQGTFVFGFYMDGEDGQIPVILGCLGINDFSQVANGTPTFQSFTGFNELTKIPSFSIKNTPGGDYATNFSGGGTFVNIAEIITESTNGDNTIKDYSNQVQNDDGDAPIPLPPPPDCKSPLSSVILQLQRVIQQVEAARKATYDYRAALIHGVEDVEAFIDAKIQEGARIIAGAIKWVFTEIEKFVIAQFNNAAKKFYYFLMPNEQPLLKEAMEKGSDIIACLFKKLMAMLFDMAYDFLKGLVDRAINTAECIVNNFLGGLLGQLVGLINGALDEAFGLVKNIINGIGDIADDVFNLVGGALQLIVDVLSFLNCEERPECTTVENWSIWDGAQQAANLGSDLNDIIRNITNISQSITDGIDSSQFDFKLDFDKLYDATGKCFTGPRACGPPTASIFGSGQGALVNLIVSAGGEIMGGDVIDPGYGYDPEKTRATVVDDCGIGQGAVIYPTFGTENPNNGIRIIDPNNPNAMDPNNPAAGPGANPSFGVTGIVVTQPGKGYLPTPNGATGGDGRVWKDPKDTVVVKPDGTVLVPIPPGNPVVVEPGDEVTTPPTTTTQTDTGQPITGGVPTTISLPSTIITPEPTLVTGLPEYPSLSTGAYPVILYLCEIIIINSGINYKETDKIVIEPSLGAKTSFRLGDLGQIVEVKVTEGGEGFTEMPKITVESETGFNAQLIPKFCIDRSVGENDLERNPELQEKVISVVDCVGTVPRGNNIVGYVNGEPYYGPFHIHNRSDGSQVKMVGAQHISQFHETIYPTVQESLDNMFSAVRARGIKSTVSQTTPESTSTPTPSPSPTPGTSSAPTPSQPSEPGSGTAPTPSPSPMQPSGGGGGGGFYGGGGAAPQPSGGGGGGYSSPSPTPSPTPPAPSPSPSPSPSPGGGGGSPSPSPTPPAPSPSPSPSPGGYGGYGGY